MPTYRNHLGSGYRESLFKKKPVASSLNSLEFQQTLSLLKSQSASVGVIPPGFEHRPDKIADLFYGSPTLDWVVLWVNDIYDPFEQLNVGDRITIVSLT